MLDTAPDVFLARLELHPIAKVLQLNVFMISLVIALMIALGGGVSIAAEGSVPGDTLYTVKTQVNEQVRGMIATSAEAKAEWEAKLAERRLEEAAELEAEGKLDADVEQELSAAFTKHAEAAVTAAANIGSSGQDGVNVDLDIRTRLNAAVAQYAELFTARDSASGQASGKRVFVLPHVLEAASFEYDVKAPRDVATGQSSGRVMTADVDGDGTADVEAHTDGSMSADGTINTEVKINDGTVRGAIKGPLGE